MSSVILRCAVSAKSALRLAGVNKFSCVSAMMRQEPVQLILINSYQMGDPGDKKKKKKEDEKKKSDTSKKPASPTPVTPPSKGTTPPGTDKKKK